jgi:phosphoribosylformimino-5-aminoimidazole carboxamide ribotide isomerase
MQIIPAIDIMYGKCVRLVNGDFSKSTIYSDSPSDIARKFTAQGAKWLHVVDLDGAKSGVPVNHKVVELTVSKTACSVQVSGGIRTSESARRIFDFGVDRIVIGTAVIENHDLLRELAETYAPHMICVSLDFRSERLALDGWTRAVNISLEKILRQFDDLKIRNIMVTDVTKDGTLKGPNLKLLERFDGRNFNIIASGGVSSMNDLEALSKINISGVIIGKALYENKIDLPTAIKHFAAS